MIRQVGDTHKAAIVDVVTASPYKPQMQREAELVTLDIHESVAVEQAIDLDHLPQV